MPRSLRALSSVRPPLLPPRDRFLPAGLGVARPDSAPSADPRAPGAASPPRRPPGARPPPSRSPRAPRAPSLSRSPRQARSRPARSGLRLLPAPVSAVTALGNMATEGMILTNHDHQIRVGVLTGNLGRGGPGAAAATVLDLPEVSRSPWCFSAASGRGQAEGWGPGGVFYNRRELLGTRVFPCAPRGAGAGPVGYRAPEP